MVDHNRLPALIDVAGVAGQIIMLDRQIILVTVDTDAFKIMAGFATPIRRVGGKRDPA